MPSRDDIYPAGIAEALPYVVFYDVVPGSPARYGYRLTLPLSGSCLADSSGTIGLVILPGYSRPTFG